MADWQELTALELTRTDQWAKLLEEHPPARIVTLLQRAQALLDHAQSVAHLGTWERETGEPSADWSAGLFELTGFDPALGVPTIEDCLARIHPDDVAECRQALVRALSHGEGFLLEYRFVHPTRGTRWFEEICEPAVDGRGAPACLSGSVQDISDRRRIESELERHRRHLQELIVERAVSQANATERAERAHRARSAFLAGMTHEIRLPLNAILGLARQIERAGVPAGQSIRLHKIEDATTHLLAVVGDVLDHCELEAGRLELDREDFSLAVILEQVRSVIAPQAAARAIGFRVHLGHAPIWLRGDPNRLRQALLHYATNALRFTEHGEIVIRVEVERSNVSELLLRFEVRDTGVGIEPERIERLFHAFEQPDESLTSSDGLLGLGLAITRRLARLMGGDAGASGEPGVGSCFWFTAWLEPGEVPAFVPGDEATASALSELRRLHSGARVLLVEDNPINREVAGEMLAVAGLPFDVATDGVEALSMASANAYELILMDVQMPRMDGLQATRAIRALAHLARLPVLAMTGNDSPEDRRACAEAGMNDFVAKPVHADQLYRTLLRWMGRPGVGLSMPVRTPYTAPQNADAPLPRIEGVDQERGLASVGANRRTYRRLLKSFCDIHAGDARSLAELLRSAQPLEAARLAHRLRGSALSLGIVAIDPLARDLERALLESAPADEIGSHLDRLSQALARVIAATLEALAAG
ncbi:MAG: response regulator [Burkholderiales bacterium]|nr:response regulator [Burkholderiales bacterium]